MATSVDDLLNEARLIADYCRQTGCLPTHKLFDALAAVERSDSRKLGDAVVVDLQKVLHDASGSVSYHTRARLLATKDASAVKREESRLAFRLLIVSVLLMTVLGFLVAANKRGTAISRELESLIAMDAKRTYALTLWSVSETRRRIDSEGIADSDRSALITEAYLDDEEALRALSIRLANAQADVAEFLYVGAPSPLPGLRLSYCAWNALATRTGINTIAGSLMALQACGELGRPTFEVEVAPAPLSRVECELALERASAITVANPTSDVQASALETRTQAMAATARRLSCINGAPLLPEAIQDFSQQIRLVNDAQSVYATILPALFGAFGAIVFHLRRMMSPRLPNPTPRQLLHRVVMGALVGTLLAFVGPELSPIGALVPEPGPSTFLAAFLIGFSLNLFFKTLERVVGTAESRIDSVTRASPTPGDTQAAAQRSSLSEEPTA